jgi:hypothetical protein
MIVPDVTPKLDDFLKQYDEDENIWWGMACGHHMNLFDEAVERMRAAERRLEGSQTHDA